MKIAFVEPCRDAQKPGTVLDGFHRLRAVSGRRHRRSEFHRHPFVVHLNFDRPGARMSDLLAGAPHKPGKIVLAIRHPQK
jgi:hypothetical protein